MARSRGRLAILVSMLRGGVQNRLAERQVRRELERRGAPAPGTLSIAVHFPDTTTNLYQLREWYAPLAELAAKLPVVVIARSATTARTLLRECPVPVILARSIGDVEVLLRSHPIRVVLYVNQNARNFSVMRYREPAHVFICHGESDKDYMASNQLKAYDTTLIAGPAAAARLTRIVDFDVERRTLQIGRPQIDVVHAAPPLPDDGRVVVLYAPTWEGDRPSMCYSSVVSHGHDMVAALLADDRYRVVVRPHPRTGGTDLDTRSALRRIRRLIRSANRADPAAGHLWDTASGFGWQLAACDVCITDISAVAYDWLATGKPLLVTQPSSPEAIVDRSGLIGALDLIRADEASEVALRTAALIAEGGGSGLAATAAHYFGDLTPGASMRRFTDAVATIVERRAEALAGRADPAQVG